MPTTAPPRPIARCGHDRLRSPRIGPWIIGLDAPKRDVWARRGNLSSDGIQHAIDDAHDKGVPCRRHGGLRGPRLGLGQCVGGGAGEGEHGNEDNACPPKGRIISLDMVGVLPSDAQVRAIVAVFRVPLLYFTLTFKLFPVSSSQKEMLELL